MNTVYEDRERLVTTKTGSVGAFPMVREEADFRVSMSSGAQLTRSPEGGLVAFREDLLGKVVRQLVGDWFLLEFVLDVAPDGVAGFFGGLEEAFGGVGDVSRSRTRAAQSGLALRKFVKTRVVADVAVVRWRRSRAGMSRSQRESWCRS